MRFSRALCLVAVVAVLAAATVHATITEQQDNIAAAPTAVSVERLSETVLQQQFASFTRQQARTYTTDEFHSRFNIFKENVQRIRQHNAEAAQGLHTFTMGVNQFADLSPAEFKQRSASQAAIYAREVNRRRARAAAADASEVAPINSTSARRLLQSYPSSLDWSSHMDGPVNQGSCGSDYAFSATGVIEGAWSIAHSSTTLTLCPSLSKQQLVDCSSAQGNQGCSGGTPADAFRYIVAAGGIGTDLTYTYSTSQGLCRASTTTKVAFLTSPAYVDVAQSEAALMAAIQTRPLSVVVESWSQAFQFYLNGVLTSSSCGSELDHAVILLGYGTDTVYGNYWLVKNTWGALWGEGGNIRIARGSGLCGLSLMATYPILA